MLGGWEVVLIFAVVLILFGAKKLPELARGLGTGIKEFKKATREVTDEIQSATDDTPAPTPAKRLPPQNTQSAQSDSSATTQSSSEPKV